MAEQTLKDAHALIKAGDKASARPIIMAYIKSNPTDYKGWWVMANAVEREEQRFKALEKVIELNPDFQPAVKMMDDISSTGLDAVYRRSPAQKRKSKSKTNDNKMMYLAVGAVILILACGGIVYGVQQAINSFTRGLVDEISSMEGWEDMEYSEFNESGGSLRTHQNDLVNRGSIAIGQSDTGNVDTFDDDSWVFDANSGQSVTIEVIARDDFLDPQLFLYSPSGSLIAQNDDVNLAELNFNSRVSVTLPENGRYTIVVSAFDEGGSYTLSLR